MSHDRRLKRFPRIPFDSEQELLEYRQRYDEHREDDDRIETVIPNQNDDTRETKIT